MFKSFRPAPPGMVSVVAVAGSRHLAGDGVLLVIPCVLDLVGRGYTVSVGCAVGTDEAAMSAASGYRPSRCLAFAAFGPPSPSWVAPQGRYSAPGSCAVSAVSGVASHARAGGPVIWWAGGGPSVPVSARLSRRTGAVVGAATSAAVLFFGSPLSRGTGLAGRLAVSRGLPVFAFAVGFPASSLPLLGAGAWQPANGSGSWAGAWQWVPAQAGCA